MKKINSRIEKIVFLSLVTVLVISSCIFIGKHAEYKAVVNKKIKALVALRDEVSKSDEQGFKLASIDDRVDIDLLKIKRNIFIPFEEDDKSQGLRKENSVLPVLELIEIGYKPLKFQYQGRIVYPDGQVVAQINANNKSYLVKVGSRVAKYKVDVVDKDSISLKTKKGVYLNIEYLKTAFSDELMAKIRDNISGKIEIVYTNSNIYGYKVLDIEGDSVILSKYGQHLRLQKGMVQK